MAQKLITAHNIFLLLFVHRTNIIHAHVLYIIFKKIKVFFIPVKSFMHQKNYQKLSKKILISLKKYLCRHSTPTHVRFLTHLSSA